MSLSRIAPLRLLLSTHLSKDLTTHTLNSSLDVEYAVTTVENGLTIDKADLVYYARRTVTNSGTPDTIDLAGSLTDPVGSAVVMVEVVGFYLRNRDATQILTVGAGSNPWITWLGATGDAVKVRPLGFMMLYAPDATAYAVTAGTGDIVTVTTDGGTNVAYDVWILGRSA
jgi:hypothetical protein